MIVIMRGPLDRCGPHTDLPTPQLPTPKGIANALCYARSEDRVISDPGSAETAIPGPPLDLQMHARRQRSARSLEERAV